MRCGFELDNELTLSLREESAEIPLDYAFCGLQHMAMRLRYHDRGKVPRVKGRVWLSTGSARCVLDIGSKAGSSLSVIKRRSRVRPAE